MMGLWLLVFSVKLRASSSWRPRGHPFASSAAALRSPLHGKRHIVLKGGVNDVWRKMMMNKCLELGGSIEILNVYCAQENCSRAFLPQLVLIHLNSTFVILRGATGGSLRSEMRGELFKASIEHQHIRLKRSVLLHSEPNNGDISVIYHFYRINS
jgi:hypothetical protein